MNHRIILFVISCAILITVARYEINFFNYGAPIPHERWESITFKDFKGLKKPYDALYGGARFCKYRE